MADLDLSHQVVFTHLADQCKAEVVLVDLDLSILKVAEELVRWVL